MQKYIKYKNQLEHRFNTRIIFYFFFISRFINIRRLCYKDSLNNTQKYLLSDPKTQPFELFQVIEEKTEELAKSRKNSKRFAQVTISRVNATEKY